MISFERGSPSNQVVLVLFMEISNFIPLSHIRVITRHVITKVCVQIYFTSPVMDTIEGTNSLLCTGNVG